MRILKPEVAKARKEKILRWVIQQYVETRRPIGSQMIAKGALQDVSSATIRNILAELEQEGYLYQPHTSGGRIPTDKAYRYYVDYLSHVQKMAARERQMIEQQYENRVSEVNNMLVQTSRLLAMLSGAAGFVYTAQKEDQRIQRLDFIPLSSDMMLAVLVLESGSVKHWPVRTAPIALSKLRILSRFINDEIAGHTLAEARQILWQYIQSGHPEISGMADVAAQVLKDMQRPQTGSDELYVEGFGRLLENTSEQDYEDLRQMMRIVEERDRFSSLLNQKMASLEKSDKRINVTIGSENELQELKNLSIVSTACRVGEKTIGMIGIIGPKHMEYTRVMSLVNYIGSLLEASMNHWTALPLENEDDYE